MPERRVTLSFITLLRIIHGFVGLVLEQSTWLDFVIYYSVCPSPRVDVSLIVELVVMLFRCREYTL